MSIGPHGGHMLKLFGMHVERAFGHVAYQVGSSLTEKKGWRDVDVRLILPNDEYEAYFGDPFTPEHQTQKWTIWNMAWTSFGKELTGLPIDFQIQPTKIANQVGADYDGPRSALLFVSGSALLGEPEA